jgi:hypothetical protein
MQWVVYPIIITIKIGAEDGGTMKEMHFDITIAGGGIAGICAAVTAARKGLKALLINDRPVLGGNASSEIGVTISGASHHGLNPAIYAKEGGLIEEIRLRMSKYSMGGGYDKYALLDAVFFDLIYENENLILLLNTSVYSCEVKGNKITRVYARHHISNEVYDINSKIYVDATGNGTLAYEAGCSYHMGREGKDEYGEFWAPEKADKYTMGNTFYFETYDCGHEVTYIPPAFAHKVENMEFIKEIHNPKNHRSITVKGAHWSFEYGGQVDVIYQSEDIDLELRKLIFGIWDYIKNSGNYPEAKNYVLKRIYTKSGARESRRFIGDYFLTENDIEDKLDFKDSICIGGWPMDIHAPLGIYDTAPATNFVPVTGIYNIPMRSLYSKDIDNLMLAGRDISASHIALGSTRVMATCGAMGQAVATAAKYCIEKELSPKEVTASYIKELQRTLAEDDQTIIGIRNINPVMEKFRASATSEKCYENVFASDFIKLNKDYGIAWMLGTEQLESVKIKVKNSSNEAKLLTYKILTGIHKETFLPEKLVREGEVIIPENYEDWFQIPINADRGMDGKLYLIFVRNEDISLGVAKDRPIGAVTLRMYPQDDYAECNHDSIPLKKDAGYRYLEHRYERNRNILFKDMVPEQRLFAPEMALSPYSRPYGIPNLWIGAGEFPHTLTLTAKEPVYADRIAFIFDSFLENDSTQKLPECLVKDYEVKIYCQNGVITKKIKDNWKRYEVHQINASGIKKIEVTVISSWGAEAGIYGVNLI